MSRPLTADDFWAKFDRTHARSCWNWRHYVNGGGYGYLAFQGRRVLAHRLAWELTHGAIPGVPGTKGTCICHHCDNRLCCNPEHLYVGTAQTNAADRASRGRGAPQNGEHAGNGRLTWPRVRNIRARIANGERHATIAMDEGVCRATVSHIGRGLTWRE